MELIVRLSQVHGGTIQLGARHGIKSQEARESGLVSQVCNWGLVVWRLKGIVSRSKGLVGEIRTRQSHV